MTFDRFFTDFPLVENIFNPAVHFPSVKELFYWKTRLSKPRQQFFFKDPIQLFFITVLCIYLYVRFSNIYKFSCMKIIKPADSVNSEECIFMASVISLRFYFEIKRLGRFLIRTRSRVIHEIKIMAIFRKFDYRLFSPFVLFAD